MKKEKRTLDAVLICLGVKGLGDNPEQISQLAYACARVPQEEGRNVIKLHHL